MLPNLLGKSRQRFVVVEIDSLEGEEERLDVHWHSLCPLLPAGLVVNRAALPLGPPVAPAAGW
jgi:hypothetical protein